MTAIRLIQIVLVAALPSLAMAQVPPIQSPPGMAADASNAVLPNALSNMGGLPHVPDGATLAAKSTASYPQGLVRDHYAPGGFADGPLTFQPQIGTCAANSWVNDGGNCVDDTSGDGNSWKAVHQFNILNVKEFGAKGDNATDDTAAIQAAVAAASSGTAGIAYDYVGFPAGNYCIRTPGGVTVTAQILQLVGYGNAIVKSCGNTDTTLITLNGAREKLSGIGLTGYNSPAATQSTLVVGSSCVECIVESPTIQFGYIPLTVQASDAVIRYTKAVQGFGPSIARASAGAFWIRDKFDQPYPTNTAPTRGYTLSAWSGASHVYAANDLVTVASGAWVLQATTGCTSSGSEPAVAAYGVAISNGSDSCVWQLAAPGTYYALEIQSGATPTFVDKLDATGAFAWSVALTNNGGGAGPQLVTLRDGNYGSPLSGGVLAAEGAGLMISGGSATNCVLASCEGVSIASSFSDKATVEAMEIYGNAIGVSVGQNGSKIINNSIHGNGVAGNIGIDVLANTAQFLITNNDLSTGAAWGSNATAIKVEAGTSDYYSIVNNLVHGATTGVSDGGTGTHKTVIGNN